MNASKQSLLSGLAAIGLTAGPIGPAHATLQLAAEITGGGPPVFFTCVDNAACDSNPATGTIEFTNLSIDGLLVNGELITSTSPGPPDILSWSALSVLNMTGVAKSVTVTVGDTGFSGPLRGFSTSGSGTWQSAIGGTITMNWYTDAANVQGATTPTDTPGTLVSTFTNTAGLIVDSFSTNDTGSFFGSGPFSMTEQIIYTLPGSGELLNRGMTEELSIVPEPSTWTMMVIGFIGLGYAAIRRGKKVPPALAL
jgi:hypothetical protein